MKKPAALENADLIQQIKRSRKKDGHIICLFTACKHWHDVCLGVLSREGLDIYLKHWREFKELHNCRCRWEKNISVKLVDDYCPICQPGKTTRS